MSELVHIKAKYRRLPLGRKAKQEANAQVELELLVAQGAAEIFEGCHTIC
jgi:hypothetical protein